jgi:glycosyltransferase involved in cell wall biosynthesis
MRAVVFVLRDEVRVSGEAESMAAMLGSVRQQGVQVRVEPTPGDMPDAVGAPIRKAASRLARLARSARTLDMDVLVVKIPTAAQLPFAWAATRRSRCRVVYWIDGLMWHPLHPAAQLDLYWRETALTLARTVLNQPGWAALMRRADLDIVVASRVQQQELQTYVGGRARITCIPNASAPHPVQPRRHANQGGSLGYLGHALATKGIWDILHAARIARSQGVPDFVFALSALGDPAFGARARHHGFTVHNEVDRNAFYASLRALFIPYWTDWGTQVFPNTLLECLQHGVPVVTSDLPVTREMFDTDAGPLAILLPPRDPQRLAQVMREIWSGAVPLPSPERLQSHYVERFDPHSMGPRWRAVLAGEPVSAPAA